MRLRRLTLLVAGILTVNACGGAAPASEEPSASAGSSATPSATSPATQTPAAATQAPTSAGVPGTAVTVSGSRFTPPVLLVPVGGTVTWTNQDTVRHSATADDGAFDGPLPDGGTFSNTFPAAGTFRYHCRIHPRMTGTITVG